jgi:glycosyltransferase involved in cell wall biosynthesis
VPHFAAPVRAGFPLVVTVHDVIPLVLPEYRASPWMRAHLAIMRRTVRAARLILTPSHAARDDIVRILGMPSQRIRVIPEAAGPEFRPAEDWTTVRETAQKFGIRERYIFNVGGFDIRKNLPVLLEAFSRARPRLREPAQLVIAGAPHTTNPRVFPPLQPVIERLGISDAVILTGRITEPEKRALYQGAALYVTPSLYEGFGLTALEAMACGVPTIAANRTSLPEVVGEGGILVEPEPEALATAIAAVLNDPAEAATWRARALARAATFDWRRTAELTLEAYREALHPEIAKGVDGGQTPGGAP